MSMLPSRGGRQTGTVSGRDSGFANIVGAWCKRREHQMGEVYKTATLRLIQDMQLPVSEGGNMPVYTGYLRASLVVSRNAPRTSHPRGPKTSNSPNSYTWDQGAAERVIRSARGTDTLFISYTAPYAAAQEYGTQGHVGKRFIGRALQNWHRHVSAAVRATN